MVKNIKTQIKILKHFYFVFLFISFLIIFSIHCPEIYASNLSISNVSLQTRNNVQDTAIVQFDLSWDNSWKDATNHDAVWVFLKVTKSGTVYHGMMKDSGANPTNTSPGSSSDINIYVPTDKMGAFIRRSTTGTGTITSQKVKLNLDYAASPLSAADSDTLTVKVMGIEMAFIPVSAFYAGDTSSNATFKRGSADTQPWYITSEGTISVTNALSLGYYYTRSSVAGTNEDTTGSVFTIPAAFPKGYAAFYCMKYELTEGEWVDFINSMLSSTYQSNRDITSSTNGGKNTDTVQSRNTISQTSNGTSSAASTSRTDRAESYISWMDLCAYLDWAGLRPMTELEFEKVARGPSSAVSGEYAWGSTSITAAVTFSISPESGAETISTASANANYNNTTLSSGDTSQGAQYLSGPMRAGIFATGSSTRATSGAGYYGVMELSGNLYERTITVGNSDGRNFSGLHGDGILNSTASYESNANVTNWPHTDTIAGRGVTKSGGSNFKGGSLSELSTRLRMSDRNYGAYNDDVRGSIYGGRGVRTYDGP